MSNSYTRVIPRDLFNEAKLLKCLGQLCLKADEIGAVCEIESPEEGFKVMQDQSDGSIFVENFKFSINGHELVFYTPLNSRKNYPLVGFYDVEVFDDQGNFSGEFIKSIESNFL